MEFHTGHHHHHGGHHDHHDSGFHAHLPIGLGLMLIGVLVFIEPLVSPYVKETGTLMPVLHSLGIPLPLLAGFFFAAGLVVLGLQYMMQGE